MFHLGGQFDPRTVCNNVGHGRFRRQKQIVHHPLPALRGIFFGTRTVAEIRRGLLRAVLVVHEMTRTPVFFNAN